ncbi:MAG: helix-turn-helix transcriptional regulator [Bacillota bacterium]|nr:helix-turn-helix transcriptional regulator [Bacillota bacterium]
MTISKIDLGRLIKEARKIKSEKDGKKFTQKNLADVVNRSRSYIGDIEAGRTYPSFVLLTEIAHACNVDISFFDSGIDEKISKYMDTEWNDATVDEKEAVKDMIKNDPSIKMNYIYDKLSNDRDFVFDSAQDAIKFILEQPALMAYGGYNLKDMSDDEILEVANDLLLTLKVSLERRKKK